MENDNSGIRRAYGRGYCDGFNKHYLECAKVGVGEGTGPIDITAERDSYRDALRAIAEHPHCVYTRPASDQYALGVADGHRCAAKAAKAALGEVVYD